MVKIDLQFAIQKTTDPGHKVKCPAMNVKLGVRRRLSFKILRVGPALDLDPVDWSAVTSQLALVDTGADLCCIDSGAIDLNGISRSGTAVGTATTHSEENDIFDLELKIDGVEAPYKLRFIKKKFAEGLSYKIILGMEFIKLGRLAIEKGMSGTLEL